MALEEEKESKKEELNNDSKIEKKEASAKKEAELKKETVKAEPKTTKKGTKQPEEEKAEVKEVETEQKVEQKTEPEAKQTKEEEKPEASSKSFKQVFKSSSLWHTVFKIIENIFFTFLAVLALAFTVFTLANTNNSKIASGVSILGIEVSGLDKTEATNKITHHLVESMQNDILLKHNDFETNIGPEQLEVKFNVESSVDAAFDVGSGNNIFSNSFKKLSLIVNPIDIKPEIAINDEQLESALGVISTQLPDAVIQSDYYVDGENLIVTSGKSGVIIDVPVMKNIITTRLNDLSFVNSPINIVTIDQEPTAPDIEKIYNEIHKEASDAHFDAETHIVYPEETGLDFNISLDEAKEMFNNEQEEYVVPLKVLYPSVTTNMIGMEAFPDLLSSFSTKYPASNKGRTTNLKLAASKVNGTVVLPGETFSYNSTVGERTIAAGYKEAAVYQDGQVVQGLGGGICQISTTLYNAALYANLEIVERRNHQFVPSYVGAGRDATVVYGSQDFKFKNNRNYAIKIVCSVEGGIAKFDIYGLSEPNDYEVVITSGITSRGSNSFTSATYKTLKQNGEVVSTETISRDTYKSH